MADYNFEIEKGDKGDCYQSPPSVGVVDSIDVEVDMLLIQVDGGTFQLEKDELSFFEVGETYFCQGGRPQMNKCKKK